MGSTLPLPRIPKLLIDADALVAGAFSTTGASHIILKLGELSILECVAPVQVREEAERNLRYKMPDALPLFRVLVSRAITIIADPSPTTVLRFAKQAHPEDVSILAAAALSGCEYLVTFNIRHYYPEADTPVAVISPGKFLQLLRHTVSRLVSAIGEE